MTRAFRPIGPLLLLASAAAVAADSFTIRCDWFDRGNVNTTDVARSYADKYPCIVNGGVLPNQAEYDLDFPVAADYAISALYASAGSRPVNILLDGKLLAEGFKDSTGGFRTSQAKWFTQCTAAISQGKHTLKLLCPGACIPHICALRFESPIAFPKDWAVSRRKPKTEDRLKAGLQTEAAAATLADRDGYLGFYTLNPPDSYDYSQPYDPVPLPNPRAHRILEYALMGKHEVKADIVGPATAAAKATAPAADDPARNELLQAAPLPAEEATDWVANLSVQVDDKRVERDTLPLSPKRLRGMLDHTLKFIADFRTAKGVGPDLLEAQRSEATQTAAALGPLLAEPDTQAKWQRFYGLYLAAFKLKDRVALSNPLLDFASVLVAKRLTYNTSHIYTIYFDGIGRWKPGSGIFALSPVRPDGRLTCLTPGLKTDGIYRDPDLHWDGQRLLFAFKPDPPTPFRIFEAGIDGGDWGPVARSLAATGKLPSGSPRAAGLRQIADSKYDDVDPCYLPDDRIAFISTRTERVTLCHNAFTVSNLFTMNADGSGIRCISTNTIHDFTPSVLADGQIAVSQWRYIDKHVGNNQSLWRCNPDGTRCVHVSGAHFGPVTYWGARQVPGSQLIACILGPHMPYAVGPVALVNPMWTYSSPAIFANLTPEIPPPSHASWQRPDSGYYADVFPLSQDYFLVSYCYGPDNREPAGYGIYLLDRWNNRDLVYRDPELSAFEVFPVKPRPRPALVAPTGEPVTATPPHADPAATAWGTLYVLDVYRGLTGIPRGEVKYLRILEEIPKPVSSRTHGHGLQNPAISDRGQFSIKRLWGTVPVEPDGSAHFKAPANKAIYFSALDKDFMEVQRMRTYTTVAPDERLGCVGCHEEKFTSPPVADVAALRREPSDITPPPYGGVHGPDFYYDAQPVLNRHCVKCHSGPKPKGGVDLSPDYTAIFNVAYETLVRKGLVSFVNIYQVSTLLTRPPKYYGSHASKAIQVLRTTHKDRVSIPPEDWRRLVTWIDCNAPYYGTYVYTRPNTTGGRDIFAKHKATLDGVHKSRCASCHAGNAESTVFRMRLPATESRALMAPLAKAAGGDALCRGKADAVFADKTDPDYQKLLAVYADIAADPRVDMRRERPPLTDPGCRYVYRPGVVREAPR